jgi:dTDP-4-amino-4,6-dideoxygalactose transaminase
MSKLAIHGGSPAAAGFETPEWPVLADEDRQAVMAALDSKRWCRLASNSYAEAFETAYAEYHQARYAVAVSNGTVALELALLASGIRPGDEVLVPAVTFIASAGAIVRVGAVPIFVDSDPETLAVSAAAAEAALTPRTRGIVAVHYGGYPVDFEALLPVVEKHNLVLIEDCAHAQGTAWRGRKVGTFGRFGAFSFQETKALSGGEGGIVLTNDDRLAEEARLYHNIGRVIGRPGYEHLVLASNYRLPELSAALLLSQLSRLQAQVEQRMRGANFLADELEAIGGIKPLKPDSRITQRGYYFMVLRYDRRQFADVPLRRFVEALKAEGVPCSSGYGMPLYKQPAFRREHVANLLGRQVEEIPDYPHLHLPVAEHFCAEEQITLPHELLLADPGQLQLVVGAFAKLKAHAGELAIG